MNRIFKSFAICAAAAFAFASCETYKVEEPDMTAVSDVDGEYVAFAYDGTSDPASLLCITITNTTNNEPDRVWVTLTDYGYAAELWMDAFGSSYYYYGMYYPDAIRFDAKYDAATGTITATGATAEDTRTCKNLVYEQGYYTYGYMMLSWYGIAMSSYKVNFTAKVTKDGVDTATGYKADKIEVTSYSRTNSSTNLTYSSMSGMKNTGWAEDMAEYGDYIDKYLW